MFTNLGYTKNLFILPFDHRASFEKGMFEIEDKKPHSYEAKQIAETKKIIYEAFKKSVDEGIPKDEAAILVDEEYGDEILRDAKKNGFITLLTTEKSGQKEFAFEYGSHFAKHIEKYKPTFAKALIRYNPEEEKESKLSQQKNLKILSDYCHNNGYKFLLEVLIPPPSTSEESLDLRLSSRRTRNASFHLRGDSHLEGDEGIRPSAPSRWNQERFEKEIRPKLAIETIKELQNARIEPDVWKLEGTKSVKDYEAFIKQAKSGGRDKVGVVILGRGADQKLVEKWILVGATVKGIIGFAIGRTIFWQPLVELKNSKIGREKAIELISDNFLHFYSIFVQNSY